ncbi:MAG: hypothetical protein WC204_00550 [Elusimicrobiales bacterium]|jgi:hypothetical protein
MKPQVILSLAVLLMPCGVFADSGLDRAVNASNDAVACGDLADSAVMAGQSFAGLKLNNDGASNAQKEALAPVKTAPELKLSERVKPEVKEVPALVADADTSTETKATAKCPKAGNDLNASAHYDEVYCTISSNGTGWPFFKVMGVIAGSLSYASASFETLLTSISERPLGAAIAAGPVLGH